MYCVLELKYKPHEFVNLPMTEKAFITAAIELKAQEEKRRNRKK